MVKSLEEDQAAELCDSPEGNPRHAPGLHTMDADRLMRGRVGDAVYGGGMSNDE